MEDDMFDLGVDDIIPGDEPEPEQEDGWEDPTADAPEDDTDDETDEPEDDESDDESEDDTDDEDVEDEWPKTIAGRTYRDEQHLIDALAQAHQYIDSSKKDEREPLPETKANPLTGLTGAGHEAQYRALSQQDQAVLNDVFEKAGNADLGPLEDLAMRVYNDNDLSAHLGMDLSLYIFNQWADSSVTNARKAMQMQTAAQIASIQATSPVTDPALERLRAQGVAEQASELTREKLSHLDEAGFEQLGDWILANRENYDESNIDYSDPEQRAGLAEYYYGEMLKDMSRGGTMPSAKPVSKKRAGNKSKASTPVKGEAAPVPQDEDDFLNQIVSADGGFKLFG